MYRLFDSDNCFIYRFFDKNLVCIYVGKATNIISRFMSHKTHGNLPKECYNSIKYVDYTVLDTETEATIYELYYIAKLCPKYNTKDKPDKPISMELPELTFKPFKEEFISFGFDSLPFDISSLYDCFLNGYSGTIGEFYIPYSEWQTVFNRDSAKVLQSAKDYTALPSYQCCVKVL